MDYRERAIHDADSATFHWIFSDPEVIRKREPALELTFTEWLKSGSGIFHIAGKAGSGKSTLMKYLCVDNGKTLELLQSWAESDGKELIFCQFFFWRIASIIQQKTLSGLKRALLHSVLVQVPDLAQDLFPKRWTQSKASRQGATKDRLGTGLGSREITEAFDKLMENTGILKKYRICFFIDGLDEFDLDAGIDIETETYYSLAKKLQSWATNSGGNVKMCVSSRELSEFTSRFSASQRITLEKLTEKDILVLVNHRLESNEYFSKLMEESENSRVRCVTLVNKLVAEAKGVFLWVVLMLNELEKLLSVGGTLDVLERALDSSHKDLERLVASIVKSIPEAYRGGSFYLMASMMRMTAGLRISNVMIPSKLKARERAALSHLSEGIRSHLNLDISRLVFNAADQGILLDFDEGPTVIDSDLREDLSEQSAEKKRLADRCRGLVEVVHFEVDHYRDLTFTHRSIPEALQNVFSQESLTPNISDEKVMGLLSWTLLAFCKHYILTAARKTAYGRARRLHGGAQYVRLWQRIASVLVLLSGCDLSNSKNEQTFQLLKKVDDTMMAGDFDGSTIPRNGEWEKAIRLGPYDRPVVSSRRTLYDTCLTFGLADYLAWDFDNCLRLPQQRTRLLALFSEAIYTRGETDYWSVQESWDFELDLLLQTLIQSGFSISTEYPLACARSLEEEAALAPKSLIWHHFLLEMISRGWRDLGSSRNLCRVLKTLLTFGADPDIWVSMDEADRFRALIWVSGGVHFRCEIFSAGDCFGPTFLLGARARVRYWERGEPPPMTPFKLSLRDMISNCIDAIGREREGLGDVKEFKTILDLIDQKLADRQQRVNFGKETTYLSCPCGGWRWKEKRDQEKRDQEKQDQEKQHRDFLG
jgi:hypothetical protein